LEINGGDGDGRLCDVVEVEEVLEVDILFDGE